MIKGLLIFLYLGLNVDCIVDFGKNQALDSVNISDSQLVRMEKVGEGLANMPNDELRYYVLSFRHKSKKKTYNALKLKYSETLHMLEDKNMIETRLDVIRAKIKSRYITRSKEWEFRQPFAIARNSTSLQEIESQLQQIGIKRLKSYSQIREVDLEYTKFQMVEMAKGELQMGLKRRKDGLKVLDVVDIDIYSQDQDQKMTYLKNDRIYQAEIQPETLKFVLTFKVGKENCNNQVLDLIKQHQPQSISDQQNAQQE